MKMQSLLGRIYLPLLVLTALILGNGTVGICASPDPAASPNFMIGADMGHSNLYLINMENDQRIALDLSKNPMWPGGGALHTVITADGSKACLSVMSSDKDPLTILALRISKVDWKTNTADVKITKVMRAGEPGDKPSMLIPTQTDPSQPVTALWKPSNHQLHGPTIHPSGKFVYFTQWTESVSSTWPRTAWRLSIRSNTALARARSVGSFSIRRGTSPWRVVTISTSTR
jgi:hypothetical protein